MKNIFAVCTKELYTYFVSPIAYFVCFVFSALSGFLFSIALILTSTSEVSGLSSVVLQTLFNQMAFILLFFTPVITMKLFAEERKSGTIELLLTSPVSDSQVVLGKYFASMLLLVIMLALTLLYPILILFFGIIDIGLLFSGYLGLILISSCFISLGLLMSSMSRNQIVAALSSFGFILILWILGIISNNPGTISKILSYLSFHVHYTEFSRGIIVLKDLVFYLSFTCVCLFATVKSIESSKWR
ncbi:ABC transporter permease subunit [Candidatus Poribacteria bacterium]|nr:ABC transporter permease subunit [Candidatus Poribacteria bacterium]